jgi:ATP-dependent Clp protease ATP-binding subunit ClpA
MKLNLEPEAQAALDLAKRAVPEGGELDADLLLAALCHATALKDRHPKLAGTLPVPRATRRKPPDKVPVAASLQPVLQKVAKATAPVSAEGLFAALVESEPGRQCLRAHGVPPDEVAPPGRPAAPVSEWRASSERAAAIEALSSFGRMLTVGEPPHKGVVEMEGALASLVRTLSKMGRKTAIVIGYPGTGKSALVYELARRLVTGHPSIPARLADLDIFELSPSFLRSGASMVGQYDERVKALIEILRANPKIVMFVDEIHSLFQSGIHERGPFTEANESFKAALGHGEISCIGCTTTVEYRHYIEPDGALARRFKVIKLDPPSAEAAVRILTSRRPRLEAYYAPLRVPDEIIKRAVQLTEDYLPSRFQPDKSIQLIDDACAFCVTRDPPATEVTEEALWQALEDIIGHSVVRSRELKEADVLAQLRAKILGQDEAISGIARAFVAGLGGWARTSAPRGVFFFCGPTGVGKTETAVLLAKILGGGREAMVRIDCNTLHASGHDAGPAIHRLLGVPPGYVGYARGQGGILSRIRDKPESIVLFDEIEKAGRGVGELLLQILDDGRVEDVDGNVLDFRRSFIVFTTNAGCVYEAHRRIGFPSEDVSAEHAGPHVNLEAVKAELRAAGYGEEFLGRVKHFFIFRGLTASAIETVIGKQLASLRESALERGLELVWDEGVVPHLSSQWQPRFGVRHLTTILRNRLSEQLSIAEAQGELKGVKEIRLRVFEAHDAADRQHLAGLASRERQGETLVISLA